MNTSNPQAILAAMALLTLGGIGGAMLVLPIPASNATSLTFVLGALAGALSMHGLAKPPAPSSSPDSNAGTLEDPRV